MPEKIILWVGVERPDIVYLGQQLARAGYASEIILTGDMALAYLKRTHIGKKIGVIVSDHVLADMSGAGFLHQARKICSDVISILLLPRPVAVDSHAPAAEQAYYFISETVNDSVLADFIARAFEHYELTEENRNLALELKSANAELKLLNVELEARVKEKIEEIIQIVNYDTLTGLPSRSLIQERLKFSIQYAKRSVKPVIVMCIGLDSFKLVNEGVGFEVGDQLLQAVGQRLSTAMRSCDSIGRLGSDRFCLVLNDSKDEDDPEKIAKRILELLGVPFDIAEHTIFLTAGIGISMFPVDGEKARLLLAHAETAMLQAKSESKNHYRFYSGKSNLLASKQLLLSADLRRALDAQEFHLHYQPRINTLTGRIVGVEALLRWKHSQHGMVKPLDFLPLLEETGLIEPVGEWVIREACKTLVRWAEDGLPRINMAVNLSAKQFRNNNLFYRVSEIVKISGLDLSVSSLEFEITESLLMENVEETRCVLNQFNNMGIKLAIDDFGTGYSSLNYLIKFPFHYLKIDRSFVDKVVDNPESRAIVQAIITLATSLKMGVVVEGIENIHQLKVMQDLACTEFQGYFFSEPLNEIEVVKLLKADKLLAKTAIEMEDRQDPLH